MPPRSPLPPRGGLDAAWVRTPDRDRDMEAPWQTMGDWLRDRLPQSVDVSGMLRDERFVTVDGTPVRDADPYRPNTMVWFYRDLQPEVPVPGEVLIVYQDARIVVVDKPAFLSTMPRGRHVRETALVRLREQLELPELSPAHRLDRLTSGLLLFTTAQKWRGAYQSLFQQRQTRKVYHAVARLDATLDFPITVRNRIEKRRGSLQAAVVDGEPNAETRVELAETIGPDRAIYRLHPTTGQTHQLRVHLNGLGIPIENDPLYPNIQPDNTEDFTRPLQLLASTLAFRDPITDHEHEFESARHFPL